MRADFLRTARRYPLESSGGWSSNIKTLRITNSICVTAAASKTGQAVSAIAIVHCAAQPSHDLAASRPFDDFDVNAVGTLNLLEAARRYCPESPFVHMSTNKVYGDAPNEIALDRIGYSLGLCGSCFYGGHSGEFPDRPEQAFAISGVQGGCRYYGAGVWALLWYADLLSARRMPNRTKSQRRRIARFSQLSCSLQRRGAAPTKSLATKANKFAITYIALTLRVSSIVSFKLLARQRYIILVGDDRIPFLSWRDFKLSVRSLENR